MSDTQTEDNNKSVGEVEYSDNLSSDNQSSDNQSSDEDNVSNLQFTENSDLHVISVDGVPKFYVQSDATASQRMWEVTRSLSMTRMSNNYRTQFVQVSDNELHIIGSYRFFLISYDQVLHRVTYEKVSECV